MVKSKWTFDGENWVLFDGHYLARVEWNPCSLRWCFTIIDRATRVRQASGGGRLQAEEAVKDADAALTQLRRDT